MKLFYLPHAGGSATSMYKWAGELESFIEPIPIELPGRGSRYKEKLYADFKEALEDVFNIFQNTVGDDDYVLVGHSMGATIIYELYYKILSSNSKLPLHMFFSGSKPPYTRRENEKIHMLEDSLFLKEIKKFGGLSDEMLNIDKFKKIFMPLLKEDYRILEDYQYSDKNSKIKCNISIMYGKDDLTFEELRGWREMANVCFYEKFNGGHFYMNSNYIKFASYINLRIMGVSETRGD